MLTNMLSDEKQPFHHLLVVESGNACKGCTCQHGRVLTLLLYGMRRQADPGHGERARAAVRARSH